MAELTTLAQLPVVVAEKCLESEADRASKQAVVSVMDDHMERLVVVVDHVTVGDTLNLTTQYTFLLSGITRVN